jgi:heme/copper-type cytochrome/quinol oxidase subunit 2
MSRLRPELLQWYGLFGAALAWAGQLVVGFGVTVADCAAAGSHWGLDVTTWQIVLMVVGGSFAVVAEAAAVSIFLATRTSEHDDPPPVGRQHFFASAAMLGNLLFLNAIVISGVAAISNAPCHQA